MKVWRILTLAVAIAGIAAPLVATLTTWLAPPVRTAVLALAPPVAVGCLLVLYFNWRARFTRAILVDHSDDDELAAAA